MTKPLFKYIGGKSKFANDISTVITKSHKSYSEPFCGALGAFLGIEQKLFDSGVRTVVLNDINPAIIAIYNEILTNTESFIAVYLEIEEKFTAICPGPQNYKNKDFLVECKNYYNRIRADFNSKKKNNKTNYLEFLFLQKHAFNGVYRENGKGEHNVPFNWQGKPIDIESFAAHVKELHVVFSKFDILFTNKNVFDIEFDEDTLYYLDPPYYNEAATENQYNKDSFDPAAQSKLITKIMNISYIYSNHNSDFIVSQFVSNINKKILNRKNIMTGKGGDKSSSVEEILIWSDNI